MTNIAVLETGKVVFSVESRVLRELGERLVKQPEVAILELIKNSYDADATFAKISISPDEISVRDDGLGMTLKQFQDGWMRIGTGSKSTTSSTPKFGRRITGEKGIGRFAVRFLGRKLHLRTVAYDETRSVKTVLVADFDWSSFDDNEDLGKVQVPYTLWSGDSDDELGTTLIVKEVRSGAQSLNLRLIRTAALDVVSPYQKMLVRVGDARAGSHIDPGFSLDLNVPGPDEDTDIASLILESFVLRARMVVTKGRLTLEVTRKGAEEPVMSINDVYETKIGDVYADIRFFPQRKGTFSNLMVDGHRAKTWVRDHSGVSVFDRRFRVHPYGTEGDDWLNLSADAAKRARDPRSSLALKHFPMDEPTKSSTQLNYMLKLPYPQQLVGVVQVRGKRNAKDAFEQEGLVASADREGFIANEGFRQLKDLVRGAVEAIACVDRELQREEERQDRERLLSEMRRETQSAIAEVVADPDISEGFKARIVDYLSRTQNLADAFEAQTREKDSALETMSLLGVVAGFMTHEFGVAVSELEKAHAVLQSLSEIDASLLSSAGQLRTSINNMQEFVTYSQGYVRGAAKKPEAPYPAKPRIQQVVRVFGGYAKDRGIGVVVEIERDVKAPLVPVALYNGVALNLFTNALKAVTAKSGTDRRIAFRAWNERDHHFLEVSDSGIGIPSALRERVFDPLFTTTESSNDPLGSGMGLGLSLVRRVVESFGGKVAVVPAPAGFRTCVQIRLPLDLG